MEKLFLVKRDTDRYEVEVRRDSKVGRGYVLDCKLSLKNCQAIERGYDLDELVEENFQGLRSCIEDKDIAEFYIDLVKTVITELLSDKKFSEDDMKKSFILGCEKRLTHPYHVEIETKPLLQQTEWEVEIITEESEQAGENVWTKPKFDENGCIMLKRK